MTRKLAPVETLVSPGDTKWAIAGKVPPSALEACRPELEEWLQGEGSKVVSGNDGFAALLVFGGPEEGESFAIELSRKHQTPMYLLDFDDELDDGLWIREFHGDRVTWKPGYPAAFLEERGVIVPGYGPLPPSPVVTVGVVENVTPGQAHKALPIDPAQYVPNARGVLVPPEVSSLVTLSLSRKLNRRCFTVYYDREEQTFSCSVWEPGRMREACFSLGMPDANSEPLDSILGETTMEGVLRVLDIPRHLLIPEGPDGVAAGAANEKPTGRA